MNQKRREKIMNEILLKKILKLNGFLISLHCPSEEQLSIIIDCSNLSPSQYISLIRELQDTLSDLDMLFSEKTHHRRSLKARYIKYIDERKRILKFIPCPSKIINKIKHIRAKAYAILNDYCVTIQEFSQGKFSRNLYLLPYEKADELLNEIKALNKEIESLNEILKDVNLSIIFSVLNNYNVAIISQNNLRISTIEIEMLPFEINDNVIKKWKEKSSAVAQALDNYVKRITINFINSIKPQLEEAKRKALEGRIKNAEKTLLKLREKANAIGLSSISIHLIDPLISSFNDKIIVDVNERIKSLIEEVIKGE